MYDISSYGRMIMNAPRMDRYVSAMRAAIKPDSVVLDLGSGPGLFAMLACQMGARRVYAIEPSSVIQIARDAAAANGLGDRIEFFQNFSTAISLPEPADVIVFDLRGPLPFHELSIPSIRDARVRFLSKGGVLIPKRDHLWAAVVEAVAEYDEAVAPWEQDKYGVDLTAARVVATNRWIKTYIKPDDLLVDPVCFHTVDYYNVEDPNLAAVIPFLVQRAGTARGLAVWFDTELIDGIGFSNAPGADLIYGNGLFFFPFPVDLSKGDRIEVKLTAHLTKIAYVWTWQVNVFGSEDNQSKVSFKQSTFLGSPISFFDLAKRAASHAPKLNEIGEIQKLIFSRMDGSSSLETIAQELIDTFPDRFPNIRLALEEVAEFSVQYGR